MFHTPAIIAAHLHLVEKLAGPVLDWVDNGHEWAAGLGLAWATLLLMWPVLLPTIAISIFVAVTEAEARKQARRDAHHHLRLRG